MATERPPMRGTDIRLHLCADHRDSRYKFEDGRCKVCEYWTCSPAFKFCSDCCRKHKRCQVCGHEMAPPGPDAKWTYDDDDLPAQEQAAADSNQKRHRRIH